MKYTEFILCLSLVLLLTVFTNAEGVWTKEDAVSLLEPGWEDIDLLSKKQMIIYFLDIEELDINFIRELEFRLNIKEDVEKDKTWIIFNDEFTKANWSEIFIQSRNNNIIYKESIIYQSWIVTIPGKKAEISLNSTVITGEERDTLNCIRIILEPLKVIEEQIFTNLIMEYKGDCGTISRFDTRIWTNKGKGTLVALLRQRIDSRIKKDYRYFALYLSSKNIKDNFLSSLRKIMVINNINGISSLFKTEKVDNNTLEFGVYINGDGGGLELIKESGKDSFNSSIFITRDKLDYQISFGKEIVKNSGLSGIISLKNNYNEMKEPYVVFGISDKLDYFGGLKCQLIYYPYIVSYKDFKIPSVVAELRFEYEKEQFGIKYRTIYLDGEFENKIRLNYTISPKMDLSTIWEEKNNNGNYFLGITFKK